LLNLALGETASGNIGNYMIFQGNNQEIFINNVMFYSNEYDSWNTEVNKNNSALADVKNWLGFAFAKKGYKWELRKGNIADEINT
jgi:hypothetical protein